MPEQHYTIDDMIGRRYVCAADQAPYEHAGNWFCVLTPICMPDGGPMDATPESFPNRGRITWMLTPNFARSDIRPGMLFEVTLERGTPKDPSVARADLLQVQRTSVKASPDALVEVFHLRKNPDLERVLDGEAFHCAHQPLARILLVGPDRILGPFHGDWNPEHDTVQLCPLNPAQPEVWCALLKEFPATAIRERVFVANEWDPDASTREVHVTFTDQAFLGRIQDRGSRLDAADNASVVNWGLQAADLSRRQKQDVRALLERVRDLPDQGREFQDRLSRLRTIISSADAVLALGEETARLLAQQPEFEALLEKHIEAITAERVGKEVEQKRGEILREIENDRKRKDRLAAEIEELQTLFDDEKKALAERVREERASQIAELEARERRVAAREQELDEQQAASTARLNEALEAYREGAEDIARRIITDLPVLKHFAADTQGATTTPAGRVNPIQLPDFMKVTHEAGHLDESEFLSQFADVARHHGFTFDRDDLANFHVSTKCGAWTVLTGPSGTGKSSLPRLYAEALGMGDELLWLPVRPDWLDDRDVIGAFNSLTGLFEPAPCGLVERLIAANADHEQGRGGIHLICLDEMNLARVEHYFAQFLSVLELPVEDRKITLMSGALGRAEDPFWPHRRLAIPPNVRFVGTVNVDETTHFFSPKIIDRASLLTLEAPDIESIPQPVDRGRAAGLATVTASEYEGWIRSPSEAPRAHAFLLDIDTRLREHRLGLGHRILNRMLRFVASSAGLISEDRALDFALAQMLVPRLRATSPQFMALLDHLIEKVPVERFGRSGSILRRLREEDGRVDFFRVV